MWSFTAHPRDSVVCSLFHCTEGCQGGGHLPSLLPHHVHQVNASHCQRRWTSYIEEYLLYVFLLFCSLSFCYVPTMFTAMVSWVLTLLICHVNASSYLYLCDPLFVCPNFCWVWTGLVMALVVGTRAPDPA